MHLHFKPSLKTYLLLHVFTWTCFMLPLHYFNNDYADNIALLNACLICMLLVVSVFVSANALLLGWTKC